MAPYDPPCSQVIIRTPLRPSGVTWSKRIRSKGQWRNILRSAGSIMPQLPLLLGACASDQIGSHELRRDSLCLRGRVVELDLDAVRVVEEKLEQRLPICPALAEVDVLALEMLHHLSQPGRAERDVVDCASALPCALRR